MNRSDTRFVAGLQNSCIYGLALDARIIERNYANKMMIQSLLESCDSRYKSTQHCNSCSDCSYQEHCPHNCEKCLDYIHNPSHAPDNAPDRKYDCVHMADYYVCKYACRYTSEMIYALRRLIDLSHKPSLKVLSFGCGPCTDLLALDYLKQQNEYTYSKLEYRGIDYSKEVWINIHHDLKTISPSDTTIGFFYKDICTFIDEIGEGAWIPDLVIFQYFLSDLHKHSERASVQSFLKSFAQFVDVYMPANSYIVLNDINLGASYGGGRDYFETLSSLLPSYSFRRGRFCNDNSQSPFYPRGYSYGEDSDGEFPVNKNIFSLTQWTDYSPFQSQGTFIF